MASGEGSPVQSQYDQEEKRECRKKLIGDAVKSLTTDRKTSVCVLQDHVRNAWQELLGKTTSSFEEQEITEIEEDITAWELFHDSKVQTRKPSDLRVCYLAGDNPLNDFEVFLENGVLPQNMWTIEKERDTLEKALDSIGQAKKVPNFFKGNFLDFLKELNGQFDIIYFDACGSLPALSQKQETLKAIGYVFLHDKLTSPGALITTFSFSPKQTEGTTSAAASTQDTERNHLRELSMNYLKYRLVNTSDKSKIPHFNETFLQERTDEENYSEYIVYQIIDTAYMYIPAHRMLSSNRSCLLEQSFVNKKELLKAIEKLLPPLMKKAKESASKKLKELKELEELLKKLDLEIQETGEQISSIAMEYIRLNPALAAASMTDNLEDTSVSLQIQEFMEWILQVQKAANKIHAIQLQKKSKLRQDFQEKMQFLSAHEAQPPRNLSQQAHNLQSRASSTTERESNPLCVTWIKEVFPDWKSSSELKKWKISLLLMTHLLTNWVSFILKCSNQDFKDCLDSIIKSLGGDAEDARWRSIFSQFVDVPNKEITTQMIATLLYGQMANPSFPVLEKLSRLEYTARQRQMFSNLFIFDTCRYVYEQFPSVLTSTSVARPHKQMVFRMAVDGLRKHLRPICQEDVFKCCNVVQHGKQERVPPIPQSLRLTSTQQPPDDLQQDKDSSSEYTTQQPPDDLQHEL